MDTPLISILVPVYNCEAYLDQCISSIINQDYRNLQIVLANDGSTDNSLEICRRYAAQDSRIKVLTDRNRGVATTRNNLLKEIEGSYFLFVDADDWMEPNMVSHLLSLITQYKADIAVCSKVKNSEKGSDFYESIKVWNQQETIEKFLYHKELNGALWNKLIKSSLIRNNTFDANIFYGEDALFVWNLLQVLNIIVISDKELYNYRVNPQSLSNINWTPERKGTGHKVWDTICNDTAIKWPAFIDIAKARFALEDMWALYFASAGNYPSDSHIKLRQKNIRDNIKALRKYRIDGFSKYITAVALSVCYPAGKLIHSISRRQ